MEGPPGGGGGGGGTPRPACDQASDAESGSLRGSRLWRIMRFAACRRPSLLSALTRSSCVATAHPCGRCRPESEHCRATPWSTDLLVPADPDCGQSFIHLRSHVQCKRGAGDRSRGNAPSACTHDCFHCNLDVRPNALAARAAKMQ